VLRRQPLSIYYVGRHLLAKKAGSGTCSPLAPLEMSKDSDDALYHSWSGKLFEDPLPVTAFTAIKQRSFHGQRRVSLDETRLRPNRTMSSLLPTDDEPKENQSILEFASCLGNNNEIRPLPSISSDSDPQLSTHESDIQSSHPVKTAEPSTVNYREETGSNVVIGNTLHADLTERRDACVPENKQLSDPTDEPEINT